MAYDTELADRVRQMVAAEKGLTEKKMFGGLAFLIGGNMSIAASGHGGLLVHVAPGQTEALLEEPHAAPMVMRGKEMAGWLRVDIGGDVSDAELKRWVKRGVEYARSLPVKR